MFYKDLESRKEKIRKFIRNNPRTTYEDIKKKLHIKIERIYGGGMKEAFKDARIKPPRSFERKTNEEKRKIVVEYVKKHPNAGGHTIRKYTKINFSPIFKSIKEIYEKADVKYPRKIDKRSLKEKKEEIIKLVKKNPLITIIELMKKSKTKPYNLFRNFKEIYKQAGIREIKNVDKRRIKKKQEVINFIKNNPLATQREINKACKTHVQKLFKKGIFGAYNKAGVKFPYERLKLHGTTLKEIKHRAKSFEDKIAVKLSGYGKVNRLMKTKRGFADVILERKGKKVIIEIKDYKAKDISISQIKQLNKYLEDGNCSLGVLVCHKKPRKDKFLIGKNRVIVLKESELNTIPKLIDGGIV